MKFTTTRSHLGAWCTRKLGILVVLLVLALLAYKARESANISMNQSPAVVSVRHPVVAEPTKEPPEEEGACEETWSEATELKANLSSDLQPLAAQSDAWGPHVPAWIRRSSISRPFSPANVRPSLLPEEVIQGVHTFVFFIGIGRSGTTILSLLLDAHPNAIVANNYAFFMKWPVDPAFHRDRSLLYSAIFCQSKKQAAKHQDRQPSLQGSDAYLGKYQDRVFVVGDKEAETATKFYRTDRQLWKQVFAELQQTVNVPIKLIQVVRNPFDVIASLGFMLTPGGDDMKKSEQEWTIASVSGFEEAQANFFDNQQAVLDMLRDPALSKVSNHSVHLADLVHSPSQEIKKLCSYLGLTCSPSYVKVCQNTIYREVSKTRSRIQWTPEVRESIEQKMKQFPWLHRYDFTSR